jgi:phospholipase C
VRGSVRLLSAIALGSALLGAGRLVASCSAESAPGSCDDPGSDDAVLSCSFQRGAPHPSSDAGLAAERQACKFGPGAKTSETIEGPVQSLAALQHVIVVMLENRSFDHYFGDLPSVGVTDVDVADPDAGNPNGSGGVTPRHHEPAFQELTDPNHDWAQAHLAYAGGAMDGFVAASQADNPMAYYDHCDLPLYYALAQRFAISDRYFSSLLGPTWPNRLFFALGTSCGFAEGDDSNALVTTCGLFEQKSILDRLAAAGVSHRVYDPSSVFSVIFLEGVTEPPASIDDFYADVGAGTLPAFSIVGARNSELSSTADPESDDHAPADVRFGQRFIYDVISAVTANDDLWKSTAIFITYDENGGFYDHVPPPPACDPSGPDAGAPRDYAFDQYGFRVPLIVVSPFARAGHVGHVDADHTSIIRFVEHWQGLGALTYRDANAWPLLDLFDFTQAPQSFSAATLPEPPTYAEIVDHATDGGTCAP